MSKLYIVPTPIGNLDDITLRAIHILKEVDTILAEDTRTTSFLCKHFGIVNRLESYHKFNEHKLVGKFIERLKSGESFALVTDAGTPSISDPGFLMIRSCLENDIRVECLPGATAFVPALVNSGFPTDRFCFEGFLPNKKGRNTRLKELADEKRTIILYESPYRLIKTLEQLGEYLGTERLASISRELTKIYEENVRGSISELTDHFRDKKLKGEFVIIISGM